MALKNMQATLVMREKEIMQCTAENMKQKNDLIEASD